MLECKSVRNRQGGGGRVELVCSDIKPKRGRKSLLMSLGGEGGRGMHRNTEKEVVGVVGGAACPTHTKTQTTIQAGDYTTLDRGMQ